MEWRLAKSLEVLREEVNARWPNRSKDSDGSIGDSAHASRSSDHNPWIDDGAAPNVVSAIDITHDPKSGCDSYALAELLKAGRDSRIKYIISNRKICSSEVSPWTWRPYNGSNPHDHHVHISVKSDKAHYDDTKSWGIDGELPAHNEPEPPAVPQTLRKGATGDAVVKLQIALNKHDNVLKADGDFGTLTENAVKAFQSHAGLTVDGIVGPQTFKALNQRG